MNSLKQRIRSKSDRYLNLCEFFLHNTFQEKSTEIGAADEKNSLSKSLIYLE